MHDFHIFAPLELTQMGYLDYIVMVLTIAGSLGLFLYGMKLMSESVLKVAGERLRITLTGITANRWKGIATGFLSTGVLQSSTAITVLTVSLVNAGVVSLYGSVGLIMGANIGTTLTGWLVSFIGFQVNMSSLSLIIIALAIPLYIAGKRIGRHWAEFMIGFALLFIGLQLLQTSLPDFKNNPEIIHWLSEISSTYSYSSFLFLIAGTIITMLLQSSSAVMSLTLVMASGSLISFNDAAGMIIGVNIGTTFSANLAALMANREARVAARTHFLFNMIGAFWVYPLLGVFGRAIDFLVVSLGYDSPLISAAMMPFGLAIFHTLFNLINSILLVGLIPWLIVAGHWLVLVRQKREKEVIRLQYLTSGMLSTSEIAMVQVRKVIRHLFSLAEGSLGSITLLLSEKDPNIYKQLIRTVKKNEKASDQIELEINIFLSKVAAGNLSYNATREIRKMVKVVDELETITDYCQNMAKAIDKKNNAKVWFTQELRDNLNIILHKATQLLAITEAAFLEETPYNQAFDKAVALEKDINQLRSQFRNDLLSLNQEKEYSYQAGIAYLTLISSAERLGDHCMNVFEAIEACRTDKGQPG
jgi:phosphate:Na+ symporter